eukprot:6183408-Pleurochrysis_carterae.AAC.2
MQLNLLSFCQLIPEQQAQSILSSVHCFLNMVDCWPAAKQHNLLFNAVHYGNAGALGRQKLYVA